MIDVCENHVGLDVKYDGFQGEHVHLMKQCVQQFAGNVC